MNRQEIHDAGFTAGYARGIDAKPRELGAPMELILLSPDMVPTYSAAYDDGFSKGKADRRSLEEWRLNTRAAEHAQDEQEHRDER